MCTNISFSMSKEELETILRNNELERLRKEIRDKPQTVRRLMGFLYHPELEVRDAAAKGFGIAAQILPIEKLKDLIRRMMWMINDESGSCCWHVPHALGEIGYHNSAAIQDFIGSLSYYADDPDNTLSTGIKEALKRINQTNRVLKT